ncbi:MAG TPA: uroporphyrinogen-III synthase [Candidatus Sulfotelmatobacter sp.]|nr:uroporphyrinogen-III synthase [Candidatus Sulfotelmatobacter sp.]
MSDDPKSATNPPLRGIRVLVGRARHQAGSLSSELRTLGAQVIEIPFIEIRKPRSFKPLDYALKNLATYDWLILTSVNGVEAMWDRLEQISSEGSLLERTSQRDPWKSGPLGPRMRQDNSRALAPAARLRIAAIGPATKKAIEQRGLPVDVVPKEYVAESVVRSLKSKVKGKRVLLVRAKVARDVIPRELRRAGAHVGVVEAYETVVPQSSRTRLRAALSNPRKRPHVVTFTSSSTVRNFAELLGRPGPKNLDGILTSSIGPVTSATLRELGFPVHIAAKEFTIPGLVAAIVESFTARERR